MKVAIIIPAHNEEERIERTLEEYCSFMNRKINFKIIVILNACKDNTLGVLKKAQKKFKEIRYLNFERGGKGFAVIEGFKEALKEDFDLIGFVDADMATSAEEYYKLIKNIRNYDGIIASRYLKKSIVRPKQPFTRILVSRFGNFFIRSLFLFNYRDTQCGAKLFKKEAVIKILPNLGMSQWGFDIDLLYNLKKKNLKVKEIPTKWQDQAASKLNIKKASIQVFFAALQLKILNSWMRRFYKILKPFIGWLYKLMS